MSDRHHSRHSREVRGEGSSREQESPFDPRRDAIDRAARRHSGVASYTANDGGRGHVSVNRHGDSLAVDTRRGRGPNVYAESRETQTQFNSRDSRRGDGERVTTLRNPDGSVSFRSGGSRTSTEVTLGPDAIHVSDNRIALTIGHDNFGRVSYDSERNRVIHSEEGQDRSYTPREFLEYVAVRTGVELAVQGVQSLFGGSSSRRDGGSGSSRR